MRTVKDDPVIDEGTRNGEHFDGFEVHRSREFGELVSNDEDVSETGP